jgi:hypothetical protein
MGASPRRGPGTRAPRRPARQSESADGPPSASLMDCCSNATQVEASDATSSTRRSEAPREDTRRLGECSGMSLGLVSPLWWEDVSPGSTSAEPAMSSPMMEGASRTRLLFVMKAASSDVSVPMAKKTNALPVLAMALIVTVVSGCGAGTQPVKNPFAASPSVQDGPGSRLWGDGSSGPGGLHIGCIRGRRFAVLITVHNRTRRTITLLGAGGTRPFPRVIERVAVQVRLAPPPPKGDIAVIGLRSWIGRNSSPVAIPPERDGWVQSNFLMRNSALLRGREPVMVNRSTTLKYSAGGSNGTEVVSVAAARIILTRGPLHPRLPINQVG